MDQTGRPLNISPEFLLYAEKNALFELFQVNERKLMKVLRVVNVFV